MQSSTDLRLSYWNFAHSSLATSSWILKEEAVNELQCEHFVQLVREILISL